MRFIPKDIAKIHAIDQSIEMVALTRNKYRYVDVRIGDACTTPYANKSMDLVFCIGVSEYVDGVDKLLIEIKRILGDRGYVIFTSSPRNWLNLLRVILGNTLYLRTRSDMDDIFLSNGFKLLRHNHTMIQDQYLLTHCVNFSL